MNGLMHRSKRHVYSFTYVNETDRFLSPKQTRAAARYRWSRLAKKAKTAGAQPDYGKATVGYIVHRISRANLKKMFKKSGTPCPNFATLFSLS
jgi:hypothetical protein